MSQEVRVVPKGPATLADAERLVQERAETYKMAKEEAISARIKENSALNALNEAQRFLDRLIDKVRDSAPEGSQWKEHTPTKFVSANG